MSKKETLWCLYNQVTGSYFEALNTEEVLAISQRLSAGEKHDWLVWREDWKDWESFELVNELQDLGPTRALNILPPPLPLLADVERSTTNISEAKSKAKLKLKKTHDPVSQLSADFLSAITNATEATESQIIDIDSLTSDLEIEQIERGEEFVKRAHPRMKKRLPIEIESNGKKFQSFSVDVSIGGILLEDPMPEWVAGYCTLRLYSASNKELIELTCSVVENQNPNKRVRISLLPMKNTQAESKLTQWFSAA